MTSLKGGLTLWIILITTVIATVAQGQTIRWDSIPGPFGPKLRPSYLSIAKDWTIFAQTLDSGVYVLHPMSNAWSQFKLSANLSAIATVNQVAVIDGYLDRFSTDGNDAVAYNSCIHRYSFQRDSLLEMCLGVSLAEFSVNSFTSDGSGMLLAGGWQSQVTYSDHRNGSYHSVYNSTSAALKISHDAGSTWTNVDYEGYPAGRTFPFVAMGRRNECFGFKEGYGSYDISGITHSTDNGSHWSLVYPTTNIVVSLGQDAAGNVLCADTSGHVLRSVDSCVTWELVTIPTTTSHVRAVLVLPGGTMFAGLDTGGVWKSLDHGTTWRTQSNGLPDQSVQSFARDSSGFIYVVLAEGVYRTSASVPDDVSQATDVPIGDNILQIYPNPAIGTHAVTVDFRPTTSGSSGIQLFNAIGQRLRSVNVENGRILLDLTGLKSGVYVVRGRSGKLSNDALLQIVN